MLPGSTVSESEASIDRDISAAFSLGLHQATQPLTVLQGTLELALADAKSVDECKRVIARSLEEVQRVSDCFEQLRTIMQLHQPVSDVTTFSVSALAKSVLRSLKDCSVAAGLECIFQSRIADRQKSGDDRVNLSPSRVSSALRMALSEFFQHLDRGSKVFVLVEPGDLHVLIQVTAVSPARTGPPVAAKSSPPATLRQELAQDMAASVGGQLIWDLKKLLLQLPKTAPANLNSTVTPGNSEAAHV